MIVQLQEHFAQAAQTLANALPDILAFATFPVAHWQKLWSGNPLEQLNRETRRRRACPCWERRRLFPHRAATRRLVCAVLAEQRHEWAEGRRYLTFPDDLDTKSLPATNILEAVA